MTWYRVTFGGEQYDIPVDSTDPELGALIVQKRAFEIWKQRLWAEAVATRGLSLQPREHRVATITREILRRVLP